MALSRKGLQDLEKLIGEMSKEQFIALKVDIDTQAFPQMSMAELVESRDKINDAIASVKEVEREKLLSEAKEFAERAAQLGLDLGSALGISSPPRRSYSSNGANGEMTPTGKTPARPKYRDPQMPTNTWTGKGLMPNWMKARMEESRARGRELTKEHFLIRDE